MNLTDLINMSRKYGADPDYVLAGGGNTSFKKGGVMAVKASGSALSVIGEGGFVLMDVEKLRSIMQAVYPEGDKVREARALTAMMDARIEGQDNKRPSVECILHALFRKPYVLHVHPAMVNGLTCSQKGATAAEELFHDNSESFQWLHLTKPGYILSKACAGLFVEHEEAYGQMPSILLLQNHGIFVAADTAEKAGHILEDAVSRIAERIVRYPELEEKAISPDRVHSVIKTLESLYGGTALHLYNNEIARFTVSREAYRSMLKPFTPDHIVYCRAYPLVVDSQNELGIAFSEYEKTYGYKPKVVALIGVGVFALGSDANEAERTAELYNDAIKIAVFSESFGGPLALPDEFSDFIVNWESESYRQSKAL